MQNFALFEQLFFFFFFKFRYSFCVGYFDRSRDYPSVFIVQDLVRGHVPKKTYNFGIMSEGSKCLKDITELAGTGACKQVSTERFDGVSIFGDRPPRSVSSSLSIVSGHSGWPFDHRQSYLSLLDTWGADVVNARGSGMETSLLCRHPSKCHTQNGCASL